MGKIDFDKFILSLRKLQKTTPTSWLFALAEQGLEIVDGQIVHKKTKFKVGDIMRDKYEAEKGIVDGLPVVVDIRAGMYVCNNECIPIAIQDEYEYPPMNRKSQRIESAKAKEAILPDKEDELTEFELEMLNVIDTANNGWDRLNNEHIEDPIVSVCVCLGEVAPGRVLAKAKMKGF